MTRFDDCEEAVNLLNNVKGSIENKKRTAYNLGYKQGLEDGKVEAVRSVYTWVFKEQDGERKEGESGTIISVSNGQSNFWDDHTTIVKRKEGE